MSDQDIEDRLDAIIEVIVMADQKMPEKRLAITVADFDARLALIQRLGREPRRLAARDGGK